MTIGLQTAVGDRPHRITLQNPGPIVPDGDGGSVQAWIDMTPPAMSAAILPATTATLERVGAGTVTATATHIVRMPFHPQVTTKSRILFNGRSFSVTGVADPEERHAETIAVCVEVVR